MPRLTFRTGPRQGTFVDFEHSLVVGRSKTVDLQIDDASVSRRHASLTAEGNAYRLVDLGSANGTDLNGRPVSAPTPVADGDTIAVGGVVAVFHADAGAAAAPVPVRNVRLVEAPQGEVVLSLPAEIQHGIVSDTYHVRRALQARLDFLDSLSKLSDLIFDEPRLLDFVLDHVLDSLPQADRSCVVAFDPATATVRPLASRTRGGKSAEIAVSRTLLADVVARREAVLVVEGPSIDKWRTAESFVLHRIRSAICVPLLFNGEVHGVMQVDNGASPVPFEQADLDLLRAVAHQVGMALAYARLHASAVEQRLLEHDLQLARRVQQQFLPERPPSLPGFAFTVDYVPALGVSGDFYDFLTFTPERTGIVVGDVSGKGVSAALYAARVSSELRFVAASHSEPGEILDLLNARFSDAGPDGMFVTMVLAVVDLRTGRIAIANAGHPAPIIRTASRAVEPLGGTGQPPIGVIGGISYVQHERALGGGDLVAFFTDGVSEALDRDRALFGEEGLARVMAAADGTAEGTRRAAVQALHAHVEGVGFSDDVTLLCVGRS
ncbi:MAG: SpoIIE family protein phosphatase [Vicinamibacterales bacterium]|nr:SpoIIE family protein phosphatase [Vicinamibacterales bacterium]